VVWFCEVGGGTRSVEMSSSHAVDEGKKAYLYGVRGCVGAMGSGGPQPAAGKSKLIMADSLEGQIMTIIMNDNNKL